ncbi:hypothetical protein Pfo_028689 [Paulownia fortunei]|nr:hypothetical protein Pfo_028689 [Paulownia fortunei]
MVLSVVHDPLVPALCIFGTLVVDVGNNNNLQTLIKANFPPYGRDFVTQNLQEGSAMESSPQTSLLSTLGSIHIHLHTLARSQREEHPTGVNFASAASGIMTEQQSICKRALTLTQQLAYIKDWQSKVNLYNLGARKIGVTTLPPTGCLPAAITLFGSGSNQCVARLNRDAVSFNNKLNTTSQNLKTNLPGLKLVVFDIYHPLLDLIAKPTDSGFFESRRACCGTGKLKHRFSATRDQWGHAQTPHSMCSGMDSTPLNLLMKNWLKVYLNRDLISSLSAICSSRNHLVPLQSSADTYMICF